MKTQIIIDKEFKDLIPPLSKDEFKQLEENCVNEGIRDALIIWKHPDGRSILIDGHNRYRIAEENDLEYRTEEKEFEDRTDVKLWILRNQLGRRNLNTYDRSVLALQLEPLMLEKARAKEHERKTTLQNSVESSLPEFNTQKELAKIANVSHDTIHKVKTIEAKASPETKQELKTGKTSVNKAYTDLKKVEAIENSGNEFLKQQVRDGKATIDEAFRVVTDTANKSPAQSKKEFLDGVKKEREEFQEQKESGIVSVSDIHADNENRKMLADDLYLKILHAGKKIDDLFFDLRNETADIRELASAWEPDRTQKVAEYIAEWIRKLNQLKEVISI